MKSRLVCVALTLCVGLVACPGPQESGTDASTSIGKDATSASADATPDIADAAPLSLDASPGGADASTGEADAAPAAGTDASNPAGADAAAVEPPDAAAATLGAISVADLWAVLQATPDGGDKGFLLINVHVPYEGNIPGTDANITYLDPSAIAAYVGADLDRPVVVYCKSNYMSTIAGNDLVARGYRAVRYLDGGMNGWKAAGHTLDP
ncbi:MAG TPA: rhodanese-like domain-containing protein [Myxococcales bacterium]|jgi:rhodanese-related sulfurtransferase